jgi:hypothetical protein
MRPAAAPLALLLVAGAFGACDGARDGAGEIGAPVDAASEPEAAPQQEAGPTPCTPKNCMKAAAECGSLPDGCGGKLVCGDCPSGKQCGGGGANQCGTNPCTAKTCMQVGASCGYASDQCGEAIDCGGCPSPATCGGAGTPNQCGCAPKTCAQLGASCGSVPDGCTGVAQCGACPSGQTCGGGGPNQCGTNSCSPKTCVQMQASCGYVSDGCAQALECGLCTGQGEVCQKGPSSTACVKGCGGGYADCDGNAVNGCEANTSSDPLHCGSCGKACADSDEACNSGVCGVSGCKAGTGDCDGNQTNGCETDTTSSLSNCGTCGHACPYLCSNAACIGVCAPGSKRCINPTTPESCDASGQWQSGAACSGATPVCEAGQCVPLPTSCDTSFVPADHFTSGVSINGQNGWLVGSYDEKVETLGTQAHGGVGAWRVSNKIYNGAFTTMPKGPELKQSAGESPVRSAGGGDSMEYVLWFRTVNTVADGSSVALHMSPPSGDRLTMLSIYNDLDSKQGLNLEVFDQVSYATVVASHLPRATWIKLRMVLKAVDGNNNDGFDVYKDGALLGHYGSWDVWFYANPPLPAVDRVMFRVSKGASTINASFPDAGAQGFYFEDLCYRVYKSANPTGTIDFYRTGFEP